MTCNTHTIFFFIYTHIQFCYLYNNIKFNFGDVEICKEKYISNILDGMYKILMATEKKAVDKIIINLL